jgi:predicted RecB family nuclease
VLQVAFAALLLESVQGVRPDSGFLILGDGRRDELDLGAIRFTVDDAVERAEAVASGAVETTPYFSSACARCRWRAECLPRLEGQRDLSFVHGLTRSRRRVLERHGLHTIDDFAAADVSTFSSAGLRRKGWSARTYRRGR